MLQDMLETLWTGQTVEVKAGPNVRKVAFQTRKEGTEFMIEILDILRAHDRPTSFSKPPTLNTRSYEAGLKTHELGLSLPYFGGSTESIGAELTVRNKKTGIYGLKIFFTDPRSGLRLVFEERPREEDLDSFAMMYEILQETGYIAEPVEASV